MNNQTNTIRDAKISKGVIALVVITYLIFGLASGIGLPFE
jgi:hypothetical protein